MNFANETIDTCTHISFNLKHRLEKWEIHKFMRPLEVLAVIPFYNGVFQFTDSVSVTEYFEHSILHSSRFSIIRVCQNSILRWLCNHWWKPLYRIYIYHSLHIEKINCDFNGITLAYLIYWLNIWSIYKLWYLKWIKLEWILELFKLLKLFLFVFMHPENSLGSLLVDVHFVVSTVLWLLCWDNSTLLSITCVIWRSTSFGKFILKTCHETFI